MTKLRIFSPLNVLLLVLLALVTAFGFATLPADAILAVHWGLSGEPDRFAGRTEALLSLPAIALGLVALFWAIAHWGGTEGRRGGRYIVEAVLPVLLALFLTFQVVIAGQLDASVPRLAAGGIAILLLVIGNAMPKSQPNRFGGIRTRTTLADPANWAATHRVAGIATMAAGVVLLAVVLLTDNGPALLGATGAAVVLPLAFGALYSAKWAGSSRPA